MTDLKKYLPIAENKDILPILGKISLFGGLSDEQIHKIVKLLQKVSYLEGEYIFKQDSEPSHIYIIKSGKIKIVADAETAPVKITELNVGDCMGETSAIGIVPHSASAIAEKNTKLIVLSRKNLLSLFNSDKEIFGLLMLNIAREACRRLHNTDETLLHYVRKQY